MVKLDNINFLKISVRGEEKKKIKSKYKKKKQQIRVIASRFARKLLTINSVSSYRGDVITKRPCIFHWLGKKIAALVIVCTTIGNRGVRTEIRKLDLISVYLRFTSVIFSRHPARNPQFAICNLGFSDSLLILL